MIGAASVLLQLLPRGQETKGQKIKKFPRFSASARDFSVNKTLPSLVPITDSSDFEQTHLFAPYCNWVIPGHLMVGRYPYIEPGLNQRCATHEKGISQLKTLVKTGIRTFAELPEQESMFGYPVDGFYPYLPWCEALTREKIRTIHFPIVDLSIPDADALYGVLMEMEGRLKKGEKIYIHCWGGRGRAGLVACCLLSKVFKISADESLERIGRAFLTRKDGSYRSPQTASQVTFVREFVDRYC